MGQFISQLLSIPDLNALTSGAGRLLLRNSGDTAWELRVLASGDIPDISATYQPKDATLTALAAFNTDGILTQTAADTFVGRTLTGTSGTITITNGSGVGGNPTFTTGNNVPLLDASNTWTGATNTFKKIVGSTTTTDDPIDIRNSANNSSIFNIHRYTDTNVALYTGGKLAFQVANAAVLFANDGGITSLEFRTSGTTNLSVVGASVICGNAAIATNATTGFLYIPTCAGTPSGTPTSYTGRAATVYDTTNNKLYVYNGAWKSVTLS